MIGAFLLLSACLYVVWVAATAHVRTQAEVWGPDWAARLIDTFFRGLASVIGLSFDVQEDAESSLSSRATKPRCFVGACSPHGAFPLAQVGLGMLRFRLHPPRAVPSFRLAGADVLFWIPLLRELLLLGGARSASRRCLERLLRSGVTVTLSPGGNHEMTQTDDKQEKVYSQRGLGFVRLALKAGVPVLPMCAERAGTGDFFFASLTCLWGRIGEAPCADRTNAHHWQVCLRRESTLPRLPPLPRRAVVDGASVADWRAPIHRPVGAASLSVARAPLARRDRLWPARGSRRAE